MRFGASAVLVESTIADCETRDSAGGGAYVEQAHLTLQGGSRVERCLARWGGGVFAWEADVALLEGSVLSECHAISSTGGLRARLVAHVERASQERRHASWDGHSEVAPLLRLTGHCSSLARPSPPPEIHRACSLGGCPAKATLAALGPNLLRFANHSALWNSRGRMMESAIVNCTADLYAGGLFSGGNEGGSFLATDSVCAPRLECGPKAPYCPQMRSHATLAGLRRL